MCILFFQHCEVCAELCLRGFVQTLSKGKERGHYHKIPLPILSHPPIHTTSPCGTAFIYAEAVGKSTSCTALFNVGMSAVGTIAPPSDGSAGKGGTTTGKENMREVVRVM